MRETDPTISSGVRLSSRASSADQEVKYETRVPWEEYRRPAAPLDRIPKLSFAFQQQIADWTHSLVHSGTILEAQTCPFIIPELIFF